MSKPRPIPSLSLRPLATSPSATEPLSSSYDDGAAGRLSMLGSGQTHAGSYDDLDCLDYMEDAAAMGSAGKGSGGRKKRSVERESDKDKRLSERSTNSASPPAGDGSNPATLKRVSR